MSARASVWVFGLAVSACLAGCKTDALHGQPEAPAGPISDLTNPESVEVEPVRVIGQQEVDLVEQVVRCRALYARYLEALRDYYEKNGLIDKLAWAEHEIDDLRHIKPYKYLLAAEVPDTAFKPADSIAEADALFDEAMQLMKEGGHGVPALYYERKMKEALAKLKQLLREYPTSDKIAEAAYWCGFIHKEYFKGDERIAVRWFQRAWEWDPDIQLPARFEAAVIYDRRLHERAKALELYRAVIEYETFNKSTMLYAADRIEQLTDEEESYMAPDSATQVPRAEPVGD